MGSQDLKFELLSSWPLACPLDMQNHRNDLHLGIFPDALKTESSSQTIWKISRKAEQDLGKTQPEYF